MRQRLWQTIATLATALLAYYCGPIHAQAQTGPVSTADARGLFLFVFPGVKVFNAAPPRWHPSQRTSGAVADCGLTAAERRAFAAGKPTRVCLTVYVRDRATGAPLEGARFSTYWLDDFAVKDFQLHRTGPGGAATRKIRPDVNASFTLRPPAGYGETTGGVHLLRKFHAVAVWELTKQ